jgi:hypothetical protein
VSFATITLCVASQQVFVVIYFIMTRSENFWIYPCILVVNITDRITVHRNKWWEHVERMEGNYIRKF